MKVTALIPAHNEGPNIASAIEALHRQTLTPDRIVVVADNCADDTEQNARLAGAEVIPTVANTDKKAGALNQALAQLLPWMHDEDMVLVQDADSTLSPDFLEVAAAAYGDNVGAVGGVFLAESGGGLLGALQRMEYARYARDLRRSGKVWVLTGTATVFKVRVLRRLLASRGHVYDPSALTEDMEITLAIKHLGYRLVSPTQCKVTTEVMPTVPALFRQRLRWQRGAMENLRSYGWREQVTWPYLRQQMLMAFGVLASTLYLAYMVYVLATGWAGFSPFWTGVGLIFVVERVVTAWDTDWAHRGLAALMIFDWLYDLLLQAVLLRAAIDFMLRREEAWHHDTGKEVTTCTPMPMPL